MSSARIQKVEDRDQDALAASAPMGDESQPVPAENPPEEKKGKKARSAAPRAGIFVILLLIGTLGWHVASDLLAPSSSTGSAAAFTAQVAPRVSGQVVEVYVNDNQYVEQGDPLFALDPAPFDLAVRQAEIALDQALLALDASTVSIGGAEAQVDQARVALANTQVSTDRTTALFERGLVTQSQLDSANAQLSAAQSTLQAAEAELAGARMQLGENGSANPQIEAAQVQLDQARLNRDFATVMAPADGVITNLRLAVGQFVNAGNPALTFIEATRPWAIVDLRENQLANVQVGDEVSILFDAVPGRTFEGRVRGIAWGIDPGRTAANGLPQNQASTRWFEPARTIPVHVELVEGEPWPENVRIGSKVGALIYAGGRNNPVAMVSTALQTIQSYLSYFY